MLNVTSLIQLDIHHQAVQLAKFIPSSPRQDGPGQLMPKWRCLSGFWRRLLQRRRFSTWNIILLSWPGGCLFKGQEHHRVLSSPAQSSLSRDLASWFTVCWTKVTLMLCIKIRTAGRVIWDMFLSIIVESLFKHLLLIFSIQKYLLLCSFCSSNWEIMFLLVHSWAATD